MNPLRYSTATCSRTGGRPYNEDAVGFRERAEGGGCWLVADGLGGHGGGEVASRLAVETLLALYETLPLDTPEQIHQALQQAEQAIHDRQHGERRLSQMRSTLVGLFCTGDQALWAHIGDSRLYHFRDGRVRFQTADHSVPWALVQAGEITPAEVRHHEDRNRLLRTLGNDKALRPVITETATALQQGDAFLLCSDGFWEYVTEPRMEICLSKSASPAAWLQTMEHLLLACAEPEHDNYTALALYIE